MYPACGGGPGRSTTTGGGATRTTTCAKAVAEIRALATIPTNASFFIEVFQSPVEAYAERSKKAGNSFLECRTRLLEESCIAFIWKRTSVYINDHVIR